MVRFQLVSLAGLFLKKLRFKTVLKDRDKWRKLLERCAVLNALLDATKRKCVADDMKITCACVCICIVAGDYLPCCGCMGSVQAA